MNYPLCIDLDGTLIYTDILQEAIMRFIKQNPLHIFFILYWVLKKGKAYLKQQIANHVLLEATSLPYNEELLAWIKTEKQKCRKIVLVTATHKSFADAVANYLGIFDEVLASNGEINLRSYHKEKLLNEYYGEKKYDYIGNSSPDLPVWRSANQAIVVSNSRILFRKIKKTTEITRIFSTQRLTLNQFYKLLRIHQYTKNFLLFVPLLAAHIIFNLSLWGQLILGFISFCFIASSAYLINDVLDIEADRINQKNRAVANGQLTVTKAMQLAGVLFLLAMMCGWSLSISFQLIIILYYFLTLCYSLYFKHLLLIDVITLAILYTIRIIAGMSLIVGINAYSTWLLLFSLFFFLSLAFLKRVSELHFLKEQNKTAIIGRAYQVSHYFTLTILGISSGLVSVVIFALYLNSAEALILYYYPKMLLLVFIILTYWIMRIWLFVTEGKVVDDPVLFAVGDKTSYYCLVLILLIMLLASSQLQQFLLKIVSWF